MKRSILKRIISWGSAKRIFDFLPDTLYLKIVFWARVNRKLSLKNPVSLNEKIQWLKLNDRKNEYMTIVDKYDVRTYIANTIGRNYLIPFVGGPWESFDEIDFDNLPNSFVLKTTHDSGGVIVVPDKTKLNIEHAKYKLSKSLRNNYFYPNREWPYKYLKHRIIAEEYMVDESGTELKDYKILCINGIPENVMVCTGRNKGHVRYYFFDWEWNFLRLNHGDDKLPADFSMQKPKHLNEMYDIALKLSEGYDLVRVDLYEANDKVYFGEMTLYPDSGFDTDITESTDYLFGRKLILHENDK